MVFGLGYLQERIVEIGKEKGFVTSFDVQSLYPTKSVQMAMNKLVVLGYFEKGEDCVTFVRWKFKEEKE